MVICLSDLHIGSNYNTVWGTYNSDIARDRLQQYLNEIIELQKSHNAQTANVLLLGDLLSGSIHRSIQVTNRENAIEQIMKCAELITEFIYELHKYFESVVVADVSGNHTRMDKKDEAIKDERLDRLITWYLKTSLKNIKNVWFKEYPLDTTLDEIEIRGNRYWLCHGDYDSFSKSGIANLVMMMGYKPTGCFFGHYHTCAFDNESDVWLVRSGC